MTVTNVEARVKPPWIYFKVPVKHGTHAYRVNPMCKYDKRSHSFKVPFGARSLINLKGIFPKAEIVEGQKFVDKFKEELSDVQMGVLNFQEQKSLKFSIKDYQDVTFNLKPRQNQIDGLKYLELFNKGAVFADCGTGKTGTILWDIDLKYKRKLIRPSSVLILGKLMTLFSGWYEDAPLFAGLSAEVLWEPSRSKNQLKEKPIVVKKHGPKPKGKAKYYESTEYYFKDTDQETVLASPREFDKGIHERRVRRWKQVGDVKYGEETLTPFSIRNIRTESIEEKIRSNECDIHIINHEGLLTFEKAITERNYDYIVVDESTVIKNHKAKIVQALLRVSENAKYKRVLTGTPAPQGPEDLWSQFYFLDQGATLGANYKEFLSNYFEMVDIGNKDRGTYVGTKPVLRAHGKNGLPGTVESIREKIENRVFRCKLRDCVDLPPLTKDILDVFMTPALRSKYEKMEEELFVEIDDRNIEVTTDLAKIGKLRQLASGFIIDTKSEKKEALPATKTNPKFEVLKDFLEGLPPDEKVIIFATFKEEIKMLIKYFGDKCVDIYGDTSAPKKLANQKAFVEDPKITRLVCHPSSAAYGVNKLTVARYMVFYSYDHRSDTVYQAIKRIERQGQERAMFAYFMRVKDSVEEDIFATVKSKEKKQDKLIDENKEILNQFLERGRQKYGAKRKG